MEMIRRINLTYIIHIDSVRPMKAATKSEELVRAAGSQASAEVAECNCPDGCERDHDND
jgi:hypothetical protein